MITTRTPWFMLHAPELGRAFEDFAQLCSHDGVLDRKTKAIVMLASAASLQCDDQIGDRLRQAFAAGATKAEITETLLITALLSAEAQLECQGDLYRQFLGNTGDRFS